MTDEINNLTWVDPPPLNPGKIIRSIVHDPKTGESVNAYARVEADNSITLSPVGNPHSKTDMIQGVPYMAKIMSPVVGDDNAFVKRPRWTIISKEVGIFDLVRQNEVNDSDVVEILYPIQDPEGNFIQ